MTEDVARTIWKFPLLLQGINHIDMPEGAEILHFNIQEDKPTIWALVNAQRESVSRKFQLVGTGHELIEEDDEPAIYVGTCFQGPFVWHLFKASEL